MPVQDVTVVSVPVSDQERAKAFYVDTLGFQLIRDDDSVPGIRWVRVTPQSGATALTLVTWFGTMPAGSLRGLVLACDDLDAEFQRLEAAGVQFDSPPQRQPWATEASSATRTATCSFCSKPDRTRAADHQHGGPR